MAFSSSFSIIAALFSALFCTWPLWDELLRVDAPAMLMLLSAVAGNVADIAAIVRPCGLYHVKAQNTKDACSMLVKEFNGQIPDTMQALTEHSY